MNIEVEELYNWLSGIENLEEENIFNFLSEEDKRSLMYKFFKNESKMKELCENLEEVEKGEQYTNFIKNIVLLYPLTRELIIKLNKEQIKTTDGKTIPAILGSGKYVTSFYTGLCLELKELLDKTKGNSAIKRLNDEIEGLESDIKKYKEAIRELENKKDNNTLSKIEERDKLKKDYETLKKDSDIELLEKEIEEYKIEIENYKEEKKKRKNEKKRLKEELESYNNDNMLEQEKEAIKILIDMWKDDETE